MWGETQRAKGRDKRSVGLVVAGGNMMGHKTTKSWYDDAIIAQKQYLNMSFYLNHAAKIRLFSDMCKLKKLKSFSYYEYISYFCTKIK